MVRVAIVGTGSMAHEHAKQYKKDPRVQLVAACDIDEERAKAFAATHGMPESYAGITEMLKQSKFDAVSVVTPDAAHKAASIELLRGGKHVLCEKPLATNAPDAIEMVEEARKAGTINMVNFSYRNSSAIHRAAEIVQSGQLGRVLHFHGHYLQSWLVGSDWGDWRTMPQWLWRLSTGHGSKGVLGDVGVHILDFVTYPLGDVDSLRCKLKTFEKAEGNQIGEYKLDANDTALITLELSNGAIGTVTTTRLATGYMNSVALTLHCERGAIRIDLDQNYQTLEICRLDENLKTRPWERIDCGELPNIYARFISSIETGINDPSDFERGAYVQRLLDACEESSNAGSRISIGQIQGV